MKKDILFFTEDPPVDKKAIHVWIGMSSLPHEEVLSQMISKYVKTSFDLAKTPKGKLYIPDSPLHFNLSDCEGYLAICFSWEAPVGIDIETIRPIDTMKQIVKDHFSHKEQEYIYSDKNQESLRFWEIWNRKEACIKALGIGLQDDMQKWDCFGEDWIRVQQTYVCSIPVPHPLSGAVAMEVPV